MGPAQEAAKTTTMRLALFHEFFHLDTRYQAAARRNRGFADVLAQCGAQVLVLVPRTSHDGGAAAPSGNYTVRYVDTHATVRDRGGVARALGSLPATARRLATELRPLEPQALLVAAHSPFMELEALWAARKLRIPLFVDLHDGAVVRAACSPGDILASAKIAVEGYVCRRAMLTTIVSQTHAETVGRAYRLSADRMHVVHNGVATAGATPPSKEVRWDLVHLGAPRTYYGTPGLLAALARLRELGCRPRVAFLGCHEEDAVLRQCREQSRASGIDDFVAFLPAVPAEQVPDFLSHCRVALYSLRSHPALDTALGVKLPEYLQASLPVAALVGSGTEVRRLIEDYDCGFAESDPDRYAKRLASLLASPEETSRMSAAAARAGTELTWERIVGRFYEDTLSPTIDRLKRS